MAAGVPDPVSVVNTRLHHISVTSSHPRGNILLTKTPPINCFLNIPHPVCKWMMCVWARSDTERITSVVIPHSSVCYRFSFDSMSQIQWSLLRFHRLTLVTLTLWILSTFSGYCFGMKHDRQKTGFSHSSCLVLFSQLLRPVRSTDLLSFSYSGGHVLFKS